MARAAAVDGSGRVGVATSAASDPTGTSVRLR